ncbi:MAG TPA: ABC transporter permease, partial [Candidatus Eisenbacteria bacterium]|nr:ABC transporter permease [Candidatus Eisenbacteria bacterium]
EKALGDTLEDGSPMFLLRRVEAGDAGFEETKKQLGYEVESDVIDGYLVIPENVSEEGTATFYGKRAGNLKAYERIERALSHAVIGRRLSAEGMDYDSIRSLIKGVKVEALRLKKGEEKKGDFTLVYVTSFLFIMMLYMTILLWGVAVMRSIIEDKNSRVIEVLLSSLKAKDLMMGKILGVGSVGLTQYAIWAAFAGLLSLYAMSMGGMGQYIHFTPITLLFFVVFYVLGFLFYSTLFAMIGSVCNTDQEAQQMQTPIVLCLVFTLVTPMAVFQNPDGAFATIVSLIPFFAPITMFLRINLLMPPAWQILLSIALLVASIYLAGIVAAKIFRIGILMYGKRPDAREIVKWMKRA